MIVRLTGKESRYLEDSDEYSKIILRFSGDPRMQETEFEKLLEALKKKNRRPDTLER